MAPNRKALLLEIHVLETRTSLGPPQAFLFQAFKRKRRTKALLLEIHVIETQNFTWTSAISSLTNILEKRRTKALLLEIHVLRTKASLGFPQTLLLQPFEKRTYLGFFKDTEAPPQNLLTRTSVHESCNDLLQTSS